MHHIQRHIFNNLTRNSSQRYRDLKPHNVDPNLFMYHLRQLQREQLVIKLNDGTYSLSPQGKRIADKNQFELTKSAFYEQPRLVILMAVHDDSKGWLLHTRKVQPVINMTGFLHANLELGQPATETAKATLHGVGLKGEFQYRGSATIAMYKDEDLESYVHALLLFCSNPSGSLIKETDLGINEWIKKPDYSLKSILPSVQELIELSDNKEKFFIERKYIIEN